MKNFQILEKVELYGIENIRVFGPGVDTQPTFPYFNIEREWVQYKLVQKKYKLSENYKIELQRVDAPHADTITHYLSDFNSLVMRGVYDVYQTTPDGYGVLYKMINRVEVKEESVWRKIIKRFTFSG